MAAFGMGLAEAVPEWPHSRCRMPVSGVRAQRSGCCVVRGSNCAGWGGTGPGPVCRMRVVVDSGGVAVGAASGWE